jgi:hypothetical protein
MDENRIAVDLTESAAQDLYDQARDAAAADSAAPISSHRR